MKGALNTQRLQYIWKQFKYIYELPPSVENLFIFNYKNEEPVAQGGKIIFPLSDKTLEINNVITIEGLPVLFPLHESNQLATVRENTLIFQHDLLKSVFYFLSGYQEYMNTDVDGLGRFPYKNSIQYRLNIAKKPVVNYYFKWITQWINNFLSSQGIPERITQKQSQARINISHDIDYIDKYDYYYIGYKVKELLRLVPTSLKPTTIMRLLQKALYSKLHLLKDNNPYWNFSFLTSLEQKHQFTSVFYFLPGDKKHTGAYYKLDETRLLQLYHNLLSEGFEIGLHGTVTGSYNADKMENDVTQFTRILNTRIKALRQHRLMYNMQVTPNIHEKISLQLDNTLGFAEQIGFRNSIAHPFNLYNFADERSFNTLQLPLNVMDVTLFKYQQLNYSQAQAEMHDVFSEIEKFNGICSLLWHNSFFDELEFPGIGQFYQQLMQLLSIRFTNITICEIISMYKC